MVRLRLACRSVHWQVQEWTRLRLLMAQLWLCSLHQRQQRRQRQRQQHGPRVPELHTAKRWFRELQLLQQVHAQVQACPRGTGREALSPIPTQTQPELPRRRRRQRQRYLEAATVQVVAATRRRAALPA